MEVRGGLLCMAMGVLSIMDSGAYFVRFFTSFSLLRLIRRRETFADNVEQRAPRRAPYLKA